MEVGHLGDVKIILCQADFDRAIAEMTEEEFNEAWTQLGKFVRMRAKRIRELWDDPLFKKYGSC